MGGEVMEDEYREDIRRRMDPYMFDGRLWEGSELCVKSVGDEGKVCRVD
jgi:hypothetical protein